MKPMHYILPAFAISLAFTCTALAQCNPGPATGGGVDRLYNDGYVRVDSTSNPDGYTWYWGYQNSAQVQGDFILFHCQIALDPNTQETITDTYSLNGVVPPSAPYSGTFLGPGPLIPNAPFSRSITVVPEPSSVALWIFGILALAGKGLRSRLGKLKD
jgi:hypothetical protein